MIALMQHLLARYPFLITIFNFDDSHSAQLREQLPFLVNRFRINLNKNGVIGMGIWPTGNLAHREFGL